MLVALAALALAGAYPGAASADETVTLDTHETPSDNFAGPVATTQPLTAGQDYFVTVSGTWSAYTPHEWARSPNSGETTVCGTPEPHPTNPSPGQDDSPVGQDAGFVWARPWQSPCSSNPPLPYAYDSFRVDTGSGFSHPPHAGTAPTGPTSDHTYTYLVHGQGSVASFQMFDTETRDNNGVLTITVSPAPAGAAAQPNNATNIQLAPSTSTPSCTASGGFITATASSRGRGARLAFLRRVKNPVNVDVFQTSVGRRVITERLIARYRSRSSTFNWAGKSNRPRRVVTDGYYFVRYTMKMPDGSSDVRRVTLRRVKGHFTKRLRFYRRGSCGLVRSYKLERPVFGGRATRSLGIAYQLNRPGRVSITILKGTKVIRRVAAAPRQARKTYRVRLSAKQRKTGDYRFRLSAVETAPNGENVSTILTSRRL